MSLDGWVDSGCFELRCCVCLWTSPLEGKAIKAVFSPKHDTCPRPASHQNTPQIKAAVKKHLQM